MAAARGELPDFNLLAAFGLEEFRNEKDAMNSETLVVSRVILGRATRRATRREGLQRFESTTSTISSQIRRLNKVKKQHIYYNSPFQDVNLLCTRESKRGVN